MNSVSTNMPFQCRGGGTEEASHC